MKVIVWGGLSLLALGVALAAGTPGTTPPDTFLSPLRVGESITLLDDGGRYLLVAGADRPSWLATSIDWQQAAERAEEIRMAAEIRYQKALAANRKVWMSVSDEEIQELRLQQQRAALDAQMAKQRASRPVVWEVASLGADYVALRNAEVTIYVPITSIRGIVQQQHAGPLATRPAPSQGSQKR